MKKREVFMAIDIGTKLGWAIGESIGKEGYIDGGTVILSKKGDTPGARYINFKEFLDAQIMKHKPNKVFYEKVWRHTGVLASHVYGGLESQLQIVCDNYRIPIGLYTPTEIKKKFTGHGHAAKQSVIKTLVMTDWAINAKDDNHADACALLYVAFCDQKFNDKVITSQQNNKNEE